MLRDFGYELANSTGSHRVFHKDGACPITLVTHDEKSIKKVYVQAVARALDLEVWFENRE